MHAFAHKTAVRLSTLFQVPNGITDEESILLGDILSTAFFCVDQGGVSSGDTVVVIGCGPVGLLAVLASRQRGASQVIAVDSVPSRRKKAAAFGAASVDILDAAAAIAAATDGRGADVVLELVGSAAALKLGFDLLRPASVLSSIGVHTEAQFPFSPVQAYDKNITYKVGYNCRIHNSELCFIQHDDHHVVLPVLQDLVIFGVPSGSILLKIGQ